MHFGTYSSKLAVKTRISVLNDMSFTWNLVKYQKMSRRQESARPTTMNLTVELLKAYSWKNMPSIESVTNNTTKWYFVSIMNSYIKKATTANQKTIDSAWLNVRLEMDWVWAILLWLFIYSFRGM